MECFLPSVNPRLPPSTGGHAHFQHVRIECYFPRLDLLVTHLHKTIAHQSIAGLPEHLGVIQILKYNSKHGLRCSWIATSDVANECWLWVGGHYALCAADIPTMIRGIIKCVTHFLEVHGDFDRTYHRQKFPFSDVPVLGQLWRWTGRAGKSGGRREKTISVTNKRNANEILPRLAYILHDWWFCGLSKLCKFICVLHFWEAKKYKVN